MLTIRLRRAGAKNNAFYRVVAMDHRRAPSGRTLEFLGTYDPNGDPAAVKLDLERVDHWVGQGARMSDTVRSLVRRARKQAPAEAS